MFGLDGGRVEAKVWEESGGMDRKEMQGLTRARAEKQEEKRGKDFRGVRAEEAGLTCVGW